MGGKEIQFGLGEFVAILFAGMLFGTRHTLGFLDHWLREKPKPTLHAIQPSFTGLDEAAVEQQLGLGPPMGQQLATVDETLAKAKGQHAWSMPAPKGTPAKQLVETKTCLWRDGQGLVTVWFVKGPSGWTCVDATRMESGLMQTTP